MFHGMAPYPWKNQVNSKYYYCAPILNIFVVFLQEYALILNHSALSPLPSFASSDCFLAKTNRSVVAQFVQSNLVINILAFLWSEIHTHKKTFSISCVYFLVLLVICHRAACMVHTYTPLSAPSSQSCGS